MEDPRRPEPEALLAEARREGRGRLKVFLGAAPGVGKTYAMLLAGRRAKADGIDVVVGLVETHGREETAALLEGLEILPRRPVAYHGQALEEFDLDGALARRPRLLLVDELAHSNAPGSRHPKRFQDVEELLKARIDVWTTLNVQHIESFNDIIAQITRVRVRETLPDSVIENADEVVVIDLTPEELIKRLQEGKVYIPAEAERAMENFFKPGNLTALRELALRQTADRVDSQMLSYMRQHAIAGPWPAGERIAVCVSAHPDPMRLVRAGRRLADQLDAKWTALHIETPASARLSEDERDRIAAAMSLAEYLGGEARTVPGTDLIAELRRFARANNITQVVVGKRRQGRWVDFFRPSLVHELLRQSESFAVHVVAPDPDGEESKRRGFRLEAPDMAWRSYALSTAAVAAAGVAAQGVESLTSLEPDALSVVFLGAVLYSALRFGLFASVFASTLSMLVYNFFFLPPFYTFTIADPQNLLALLIFLIVAIFTSNLASRVREQERSTRRAFRMTAALYDFSRNLAAVQALDDLLWAISYQMASSLSANVVILLPEDGRLAISAGYPPDDRMPESDWAAANWAWEKGEPAGRGSDTLPNSERQYFPMRTGRGMVAVLGVEIARGKGVLDPEQRRMLEALLDQAAVAIERIKFANEASRAAAMSETEKFRTALLSSISHDLRTPLTSILGSVTALRRDPTHYDERSRDELLATIQEESERLERFVNNLLDITRLEAGALEIKRDWLAPAEVVDAATRRLSGRAGAGGIVRKVVPGLPLLRADFTLLETILVNLLDNALKHAAGAKAIEVAVSVAGNDLVISVTDDGIGIPREHLPRLFDKFFRVRRTDYTVAGTGLGLSICKGLVEAMGGAIEVESPASAGHGARFTLRFPVEAQPEAVEPASSLGAEEASA